MTTWRADFPIFQHRSLVYLDSAASAQKPRQVIDAITHFYERDYATIHRGIYTLSEQATQQYERTRDAVQQLIHAAQREEIVFVRGTTEGINLVAQSYGGHWQAGDEVIVSGMEHHSNIVPWALLRERKGIILKVIPVTPQGALDEDIYRTLFSPRTKLVAVTHASNVLGTINPIQTLVAIAHAHGVPVLVDGAQAVPHMQVDVQALDCDFYVFSGHKLYGPSGIGVLYGKKTLLDQMPPYQGGGGMIESVSFETVTFAPAPHRFEAGTPHIEGVVGLGAAIDYVQHIGMESIWTHEQALLQYAESALCVLPGLRLVGTVTPKVGVLSFVLEGIHPHDVGTILSHEGVAVRAGHHCAMPLMAAFHLPATVRLSFGVYNEESDMDALVAAIRVAQRLLGSYVA
jgi:cysteine desulfurase / selenocysteine lyase